MKYGEYKSKKHLARYIIGELKRTIKLMGDSDGLQSNLEMFKAPRARKKDLIAKIKEIKKIPLTLSDVNTDALRFIKGNNLRLRASPSINSEIYDELILGQVVTVLSKQKNWIEVMYEYEDGESISGWVFTRYTEKFIK